MQTTEPTSRITRCDQCGADIEGLLCPYCGTPGALVEGPGAQLRAVRELQHHMRVGSTENQVRLLTLGYVPAAAPVLVEAAMACLPLIRDGEVDDVSAAAVRRLETLVLRLRLAPEGAVVGRALALLEARLKSYHRADRNLGILAIVIVVAGLALVALGLVAWVHSR
jgi:hypothetical protein